MTVFNSGDVVSVTGNGYRGVCNGDRFEVEGIYPDATYVALQDDAGKVLIVSKYFIKKVYPITTTPEEQVRYDTIEAILDGLVDTIDGYNWYGDMFVDGTELRAETFALIESILEAE